MMQGKGSQASAGFYDLKIKVIVLLAGNTTSQSTIYVQGQNQVHILYDAYPRLLRPDSYKDKSQDTLLKLYQ